MNNDLSIKSIQGDYEVRFHEKISDLEFISNPQVLGYFLLVDRKVWKLHLEKIESLSNFPIYLIDANEDSKSLQSVNEFVEWLIANGASKSSTILAVGGGVIQDVATFTAHIYKRGINWKFAPTTLLSQSDSCIGAKCGINVMPYKNQIGVMHSPSKVWIVKEFLETLDDETFKSGFGEVLKLSLTPPHGFYDEFKRELNEIGITRENSLTWINKSLNAKKVIIEIDEYERDLRRILNYGHSFGHALEAVSENSVNHGYGVLFGIDLINYLAVQWGLLDEDRFREIRLTITSNFRTDFLPRNLRTNELIEALKTDKKIASGKIHFAVLNDGMQLEIIPKLIDENLSNLVESYFANECIFTSS
jgi:3-dehydroquinate synthase